MTSRARSFSGSMVGSSLPTRRAGLALSVFTLAFEVAACSSDVQDKRSSSASATASSSAVSSSSGSGEGGGGTGGAGGIGGSGGAGAVGGMGGAGGAGSNGGEFVAYNLFTHVPRFVIYKLDPARNLCFRISLVGFSNPGPLTIDVTSPWVADHAEVTNDLADCTMSMGFPPQPQSYANGTSGMGTIVVQGGFPCSVDVHATISFENVGPWVPASESFDVDALNVDGGCG